MLSVPKLQVRNQEGSADTDEISLTTTRHSRSASAVSGSSFLSLPATPSGVSNASTLAFENIENALQPDLGTEQDFKVDDNCFAYSPGQLNKLLNPKSLPAFVALGGLSGLAQGLRTDIYAGLSADETCLEGKVSFEEAVGYRSKVRDYGDSSSSQAVAVRGSSSDPFYDRVRVYGQNKIPGKKATPLWKLMWIAYNDAVLLLLTAAAVISLALGLYETFGAKHEPGAPAPVDWVEGVAICVAIVIVVMVGSLNDWQKERAFVKLNAKKDDREVKVVRSGRSFMANVHDILAGDVLHLEPGDMIPVDGIFISGHNVKCDESSATGESDQIKKTGGEQVMRLLENGHTDMKNLDPFIISGAKVLEGVGTYLVTSVGPNSSFGKIMISMRTDPETTPLQVKLNGLATAIAKLGSAAAALLFFVLLFRFCAGLPEDSRPAPEKASTFMDILIVAITVIVVAVPEGLPLAVTLALAFATTRLLKENNLVRILKSCEVMGNATTICSDKTGTLTTNRMTVVAGLFGKNESFENNECAQFVQVVSKDMKGFLIKSIAINSTAFESQGDSDEGFIGSKTEVALLEFAKVHLGMDSLSNERANAEVVQFFPFDSSKKCMGAVIKIPKQGYRMFVKGASEILLKECASITDVKTGELLNITSKMREEIESTISSYAKKSLRTIGLCYRDFPSWPPAGTKTPADPHSAEFKPVLKDMILNGVVGIMDPVRDGVPDAVAKCQLAGVKVRMVTGDNIETARAIAVDCGILRNEDEIIMEGPDFRKLNDDELLNILPRLAVLARSSPTDKQVLVQKLKALGDTVAVTGDGTNDGPALKAADVGFSMGISGTEVAKEASSIVLMDDNFASIVKALMWGRAVNDAVSKFLQFQITVNITAVLLTFVSAVSSPDMTSVLTAVQLLWVNLIMDTFAALALATDPPTLDILDRKPAGKKAPLITINMWKMIIGQAIFQLTVTFILYFAGEKILGYDTTDPQKKLELSTMVFNTFVWMQIFNEFNNRRLDNKLNIFAGIQRNYFFIGINCIMVGAQIAIVFVGGQAFNITPIDGIQWAICIVLAALSLPMAVLIRFFPDPWFATFAKVICGPFAVAYRACRRVWGGLKAKLPRRTKNREMETGDQQGEEREESGNDVETVPEIVVAREKDLEMGANRV
ncbi:plasma membrane calcium [Pseudogymnoascus verrucosus]|uniref:Calcium-transporting ATPase n=1 Tax=Pseudogymnoascus verrucosus TaxID=342668 RepID=A0A1B8GFS9_9PEZI|nr:plasma membrane calcium [Pseudogymnoascus verrucosus]OBT94685.1 plasma membrane calcium [Pseudogymnoascus verrucosus]